jgi:excisionase family DNA binding protein
VQLHEVRMPTDKPALPPFEALLTAEQVAPLLNLQPDALRAQVRRGVVPAVRMGRSLRFRLSEIQAALRPAAPAPETP